MELLISQSNIDRLKGQLIPSSQDMIFKPNVDEITDTLNSIFPTKQCLETVYTQNTDKLFFGIMVLPMICDIDGPNIVLSNKTYSSLKRYKVEIDSKLFNIGLAADEIIAYLIYEITNLMFYIDVHVDELRMVIDSYMAQTDDRIELNNYMRCSSVMAFAIESGLHQLSTALNQDVDALISNEIVNQNNLFDSLIDGLKKIRSSVYGIGSTIHEPNLMQLKWAFELYKDVYHLGPMGIETLKDSKTHTGSKLLKDEVDKVIRSLERTDNYTIEEGAKLFKKVEESGLFKELITEAKSNGFISNLKRGGLRSIEDDLYEFTIRVKNADTEEDAYYALRQINSRINLLEEYLTINEEQLSDTELNHWRSVANQYRSLRTSLSNKKIVHQKSYGLFYDYDQLDNL